jgi:hypothetical protein
MNPLIDYSTWFDDKAIIWLSAFINVLLFHGHFHVFLLPMALKKE